MKKIQKALLLHDTLYANVSLISPNSLDGKDNAKTVYAIIDYTISVTSADGIFCYDTLDEANEVLAEMEN